VSTTKQQQLVQDQLWQLIESLLPSRPTPEGPGGRPRVDERAALEGILRELAHHCGHADTLHEQVSLAEFLDQV
jgi:transposase